MDLPAGWDNRVDRFEAMATLLAVIEEGGFSAASRRMGTPVSTLSRRVSDLEALIGTQLLIRTTRKLALSEAGVADDAAPR